MLLPRAEGISVSLCESKRLKTTSSSSPSLPLDFCASFRVFFSFLPASLAPNRGSRSSRYVGFAWLGCVAAPVRPTHELGLPALQFQDAEHRVPEPSSQHIHRGFWHGHLRLHPQFALLLLLDQVRQCWKGMFPKSFPASKPITNPSIPKRGWQHLIFL